MNKKYYMKCTNWEYSNNETMGRKIGDFPNLEIEDFVGNMFI